MIKISNNKTDIIGLKYIVSSQVLLLSRSNDTWHRIGDVT